MEKRGKERKKMRDFKSSKAKKGKIEFETTKKHNKTLEA